MRFLKAFLIIVWLFTFQAQASSFPRGCEVADFGFNQGYLAINDAGNQAFYLIQNHSNVTIELQRYEPREVFMSPPLAVKLAPSHWGAFASDLQNQYFSCFVNENNNSSRTNCQDVLDICKYPRAKFALSNMGNYWVSSNKPLNQVISETAGKGIYLRW